MSHSTNNTCISLGQGCTSPTNLPSYIDTAACLCGLLKQKSSLPDNGEQIEMWRCIGNASANINSGGNGKWYNTSQPSQELSGINEPQNWALNPPDLSQAYVLEDHNGQAAYAKLGSGGSPDLIGADVGCTGMNDTQLSTMYYTKGNGTSNSTTSSSSSSSSSATSSASGTASSGSATTTSGATTSAATGATTSASSTSGSASAPKGTSSSAATHFSLSSALLVGMVFAPLVSLLI